MLSRVLQGLVLVTMTNQLPAQVISSAEVSRRIEAQKEAIETLIKIVEEQQSQIEKMKSAMLDQAKRLDESFVRINNRLDNLEGKPKSELGSPTGDWTSLENWRKLKIGMSEKVVRSLLGEPDRISGGTFTKWIYISRTPPMIADVDFYEGKVRSYEEPRSVPPPM